MQHPFKVKPYFDRVMESFIKTTAATLRPGTTKQYRSSIRDFLSYVNKKHPEVKKLSDLRRTPHVEGWLADMAARGLKIGTRRGRITCVRRFLCLMYAWGWDDLPEPDLLFSRDMPRQDKFLPKPITPVLAKKLDRCLRRKKTLMAQSVLLLRKTGMRVGEMMDLPLNCLEKLKDGRYVLHVPLGKLHTERIIPVDQETVVVVKRILDLRGLGPSHMNTRTGKSMQYLVVQKNWRRPSYAGICAAFERITKESGIETHLTLHQLRHTYATELLRCGISLPALMKLLGHKDITMTLRYAEVSQVDLQQAYHAANVKNKAFYSELGAESIPVNHIAPENPDYILSGIDGVITKLRSVHKDACEMHRKKKIQRILERLSRVAHDFDMLRKE